MQTRRETAEDRVVVAIATAFYAWAAFYLATPFMPGDVVLTITTAIVGALGALVIAYINSFLKEQYIRHLDAAAIAAGLAGELSSYEAAWPMVSASLDVYLKAVNAGHKDKLTFRPFDRPRDVFYEANAGRLGLLGSDLVRDIAHVYGNIGGFRVGFGIIQTHGAAMSADEFRTRVLVTLDALNRAVAAGAPLLEVLKVKAKSGFWASLFAPARGLIART